MSRLLSLCVAGLLAGTPAAAQQTEIGGGPVNGVAAVNAAAGNGNQQANVGTIAGGEVAIALPSLTQQTDKPRSSATDASTVITANSFAGSSGWVAINGAAGNDNQQANLAAIAFGTEVGFAAADALAQTRASTQPTAADAAASDQPVRSVAIGDGAFAGSQGLVQVSLIGGDRNTSANTFALSVTGSASPLNQ